MDNRTGEYPGILSKPEYLAGVTEKLNMIAAYQTYGTRRYRVFSVYAV
jgi:hypothetical protein